MPGDNRFRPLNSFGRPCGLILKVLSNNLSFEEEDLATIAFVFGKAEIRVERHFRLVSAATQRDTNWRRPKPSLAKKKWSVTEAGIPIGAGRFPKTTQ